MRVALVLLPALAAAPFARPEPSLKQAAALYHQGLYDSTLTILDACRSGSLKRRDSLALLQYSGMASARLGRGDEAAAEFRILLGLDSLFQFPRNEDSTILAAFAQAQEEREIGDTEGPADTGGALDAARPPARDEGAAPATVAMAQAGPAGVLPVRAAAPARNLVPIPAYPGPEGAPGGSGSFPASPGTDRRPQGGGIGLALGAIPLGAGWLSEGRYKQGLAMAFLQAGGAALSLFASSRISALEGDPYKIQDKSELDAVKGWQWTQRVALSTALGAYLFSLIASRRY